MSTVAELKIPFAGCRSFDESEQTFFYGRNKQVDDVLFLLHKHKFIAVTGQIGSGKSSFLQCGLIPALKKGHNGLAGKEWVICPTRPGLAPIRNLGYALAENDLLNPSVKSTPEQQVWVEKKLREGISGLESIYRQSEIFGKKNLLIVIDQFEDLFLESDPPRLSSGDHEETHQYINAITGASFAEEIAVYVVIALGAENIIDLSPYRRIQDLMNQGQYLLPRISSPDLKKLMLSPLSGSGLSLSPEVMDTLLEQFGSDVRLLPNLQFLMYQIWTDYNRKGASETCIQLEDLAAYGNVLSCFSVYLEDYFNGLGEQQKLSFEKIFKAMLSKDTLGKLTQPKTIAGLSSVTESSPEEISELLTPISRGATGFLDVLPPDISSQKGHGSNLIHVSSLVFLKNEHFFSHWQRFRHWLEEEKESREIYKRLVADQLRYDAGKTSLLRPPDLDFIWQWYQTKQPSKIWGDNIVYGFQHAIDYLTLSQTSYKNEVAFKENERKNEIKRYRRNMVIGVIVGLLILSVVSILAINANNQKSIANRERLIAIKAGEDLAQKNLIAKKLNEDLTESQDSINQIVKELKTKEITINKQNASLIKKSLDLEQSSKTIKEQYKDLETQIKITKAAVIKAEDAQLKEIDATKKAISREKFTDIKNQLFLLVGEFSAIENPLELIPKLNAKVEEYEQISKAVVGTVLPNNTLFQVLNIATSKLEALRNKSSQVFKASAGLRSIANQNGVTICGGDDGQLYLGNGRNKVEIGNRIRAILPFNNGNGSLVATFDGGVYSISSGKDPVKLLNNSSFTPAIALLNSFKNGEFLFASQKELILFSLEKGMINKSMLREKLRAIIPLPNRNSFLLSTQQGLYLWELSGDMEPLVAMGIGEFSSPVTAMALSKNLISFGLQNGKVMVYALNEFLQNRQIKPRARFVNQRSEISRMIFFENKLFSAGLDKSVYFFDLNLDDAASYAVKLVENNSWVWDMLIRKDNNGVDFLYCADEQGYLKKYFIHADDQLKWINNLARGK